MQARRLVSVFVIFPKLPVCLRACFDRHLHNRKVKDAVSGMKSDIELLENLNKELLPEDLREQDDDVEGNVEERAPAVIGAGWPQIPLPSTMCQPELIARRPAWLGPSIVEQTVIGIVTSSEGLLARKARKRGDRGRDSKTRAKRRCRRCLQNKATMPKSAMVGKLVVLRHASFSTEIKS